MHRKQVEAMYFPMVGEQEKILPLYLAGTGRQENQESIIRQEGFPYHQLIFVTHGAGVLEYEEKTVTLSKGCFWFIRKDTPHSYHAAAEPFTTRWVCFDGNGAEGLLQYFALPPVSVFFPRRLSLLHQQHQSLLEAAAQNAPAPFLSARLYSFLMDALSEKNAAAINDLEPLRTWICEHYAEDLTLDDIAAQADMSKYALCRAFRRDYAATPFSFLHSVRLQKAKELLVIRKDLTVREISALVGFHDPVYFGRLFRRQEGVTPNTFRHHFG